MFGCQSDNLFYSFIFFDCSLGVNYLPTAGNLTGATFSGETGPRNISNWYVISRCLKPPDQVIANTMWPFKQFSYILAFEFHHIWINLANIKRVFLKSLLVEPTYLSFRFDRCVLKTSVSLRTLLTESKKHITW